MLLSAWALNGPGHCFMPPTHEAGFENLKPPPQGQLFFHRNVYATCRQAYTAYMAEFAHLYSVLGSDQDDQSP